MPDRNDIIKALRYCTTGWCYTKCPYKDKNTVSLDCCRNNLMSDVLVLLKEQTDAKPETAGSGVTWYYACSDCKKAIDLGDCYCRHCGRKIVWK